MGVLAWIMMGLAIWHFTIFLPDRFWGGIVGAFLGALVLAELQDGFNLIGISANPYLLILGFAILVSMIANVYLSRLRRAGRV